MSDATRILIVDDSRIFRGALEAALTGLDDIAVVGSVFSGEKALEFLRATAIDVVTLDVEMPGLGGLATLAAIQELNRTRPRGREIGVIMVSAFTRRGAEVTIKALQNGAFDFLEKSTGPDATQNLDQLRRELTAKIRSFAARCCRQTQPEAVAPTIVPGAAKHGPRATTTRRLSAVLIASSTGGPRALATLLPDLAARVTAPILIVQHMPAELTRSLAEHLGRQLGRTVVEAADGQIVQPQSIYLAPGGKHLLVRLDARGQLVAGWSDQAAECGCRPSANILFRSAAAACGAQAIAIVLTGMGNDGTSGLGPFKRAGGYVIAQDEASSVVWGMPGSAVAAGLADAVLPLSEIAAAVQALVRR